MQTIRMTQKDLDALPTYNTTNPTGVLDASGKLKTWKRDASVLLNGARKLLGQPLLPPNWYVCWYFPCSKHRNCCEVAMAKPEVVEMVKFYQPLIAHTTQRGDVVTTIYSATPIPGWGQDPARYGPSVRGWDPTEFEG